MQVIRKNFPSIIPDNEETYFSMAVGSIEAVDELCSIQITKILSGWQFRISPSLPKYTPAIIEEVLNFHNFLGMRLDMSKSIKSSSTIAFTVVA